MFVDIADFVWCIRHSGELTKCELKATLEAEFGPEKVFEVSSGPFRTTLETAVRKMCVLPHPYVAFVDADVLVNIGWLKKSIALQQIPVDVAIFQGTVLDRFFHTVRPGGVHFYRRDDLVKVLPIFPLPANVERPEYELKKYLISRGSIFKQYSFIVGYHDYLQSSFDIYRKGFFYALKMSELTFVLEPAWQKEAFCSTEMRFLLQGLTHGRLNRSDYDIDIRSRVLQDGYRSVEMKGYEEFSHSHEKKTIKNIPFPYFFINWKILHHFLLIIYILRRKSCRSFFRYLIYVLKRICRFI